MVKVEPLLMVFTLLACQGPAPDGDRRLYQQATALTAAGKDDQARQIYLAMLGPDAGSRFQPEAHLAIAEWHFKRGELDQALAHYRAVEAVPTAPTRPYAIYKEGWCLLDLGQQAEARAAFERVLALAREASLPAEERPGLEQAAREGLVQAYARGGAPDGAFPYFQRLAGVDAPLLLERLADLYADDGAWERSIATWRELMAAHVDSPRLCAWQSGVVRGTLAGGTRPQQLAEIQRLGAVLSHLEVTAGTPPSVVEDCRRRFKDSTRQTARLWHKSARDDKDAALYQLADPLYRQYLDRFRGEDGDAAMTFFHAETLWNLGRWTDAYQEYRRTVELAPRGPHATEAAYGAVIAAKNAAESEPRPPAPAPSDAPAPLSAAEQRLLAAFALYVDHVPRSPELPAIEYRWARLLYDRGHLAEAAPLLDRMVKRHPDSELALYAADLHLEVLDRLGRHEARCAAARALVAGPVGARDAGALRTWKTVLAACAARPPTRP